MRALPVAVLSAALAAPAFSQGEEVLVDDQPAEEVRQVEVIKLAGHSRKKPMAELDEHEEHGPGHGKPMHHMKRMMLPRGRHGPGGEPDPALKEHVLKVQAAEDKVRQVKIKLAKAKEAEKPALKAEAKAALGELFDARLALDEAGVARMEKKLAERKAKLERKKAAREKLVEERVERLAGDAPGWDD